MSKVLELQKMETAEGHGPVDQEAISLTSCDSSSC
ncbi:SapB/AmfS family lanthipeptide [Kitasatospora sp. NPDC088391]